MPVSPWEIPEGPGWSITLSGNNNNANNNAIPVDKDHFGLYRQPDGTHIFSYRVTNPVNNEIIAGAAIITQMRFIYATSFAENENDNEIERTETAFQYKTITHPGLVQTFAFIRESNSEMESVNYKLVITRRTPGAVATKVIHLDEEDYYGWWPVIAEQAPDGLIPDMLPPINFPMPVVAPPPPPAVIPPPPPAVLPPAPSANNEPYEPNMPPPSPPSNGPSNKRRRRNTRRRKARLSRKRQSRRRV